MNSQPQNIMNLEKVVQTAVVFLWYGICCGSFETVNVAKSIQLIDLKLSMMYFMKM